MLKKINSKIAIKIFLIIFISFFILITSIFLIQNYFIEKKYMNDSINNMITYIDELNSNYFDSENYGSLAKSLDSFEVETNFDVAGYEELEQNGFLYLTFLINNTYYETSISREIYEMELSDLELHSTISIMGNINNGVLEIYQIADYVINSTEEGTEYETILVSVDETNYNDSELLYSSTDIIDFSTYDNYEKVIVDETLYYELYTIPGYDSVNVTFYKTMNNGEELSFNISLSNITSSIDIIKGYYIYFYLLAFILSIVISVLLSKKITNPILEINSIASKMAKMDFSKKIDVKTSDEFGELASNLNLLSETLSKNIKDLEHSNKRLKNDITNKNKQEKIREEFISNVTHEIKMPIAIIKSHIEAIQDNINKEKTEEYYKIINEEINHLNDLFVEMIKISEKEMLSEKENINLNEFIKKEVNKFSSLASSKNNEIIIEGEFKEILFNKNDLDIILNNLIENAIKYSYNNTKIYIKGYIKNSYNYIEVINEGDLISKDDLKKIWNRFYRIEKSHNKKYGGYGLGLSIVKQIIKRDNGIYGSKMLNDKISIYIGIK